MSRLELKKQSDTQNTVNSLYADLMRRCAANPGGVCPVDVTASFLRLCHAQSCGKCTPCRIGLGSLVEMTDRILDGEGDEKTLALLEKTAKVIADSADCAIGFEAANMLLKGLASYREDFVSHIEKGHCAANFDAVPCMAGCPANVDIPGYVALTGAGRFADAVRVIRADNPFPSVCALICEHPCETHCRRTIIDDAINIRGIKRTAVDNAGDVPAPACAPATGKTVAVVGGGPSGLTAAYYLSLMGHSVTVFEARERLGGMLRYGIPCYRLPDAYLDRDIDVILSTGVRVHLNESITSVAKLREEFDSVYISIGAHGDKKLGIDGEDKTGVISAVELLRNIGDGNAPDFTGKRVVIVGGGNVAMDVTRTSMRLGASSVQCVYRRRQSDMTALPEEVEGAIAEGCEIVTLQAPVRVEGDEYVTGLVVQPQIIGDYDRGRPKPRKADAPEHTIPCDYIIVAIGQDILSADFAKEGIEAKRGAIISAGDTSVSGKDGVFVGGDCASGPATVIRAIEAGKVAAANIDEYFGYRTKLSHGVEIPHASHTRKAACGRVNMTERTAEERKADFALMEHPMTAEEAKQECARCLRCDHFGMGACKGGRKTW